MMLNLITPLDFIFYFLYHKDMKIHVRNYTLPHMFVGILPSEYIEPQKVIIDVTVTYPDVIRPSTIAECYNYADITQYLDTLVSKGHTDLIETIACDVLDFIFQNPNVQHAQVIVKKPDIIPGAEYVAVEYERSR